LKVDALRTRAASRKGASSAFSGSVKLVNFNAPHLNFREWARTVLPQTRGRAYRAFFIYKPAKPVEQCPGYHSRPDRERSTTRADREPANIS
jgi:hypothetical protein